MKERLDQKNKELVLVQQALHSLTSHGEAIHNRYRFFSLALEQLKPLVKKAKLEEITQEIQKLKQMIEQQEIILFQLIKNKKSETARQLMEQHQAIHGKIEVLKDLHQIIKGDKRAVTEDGEETSSFFKAAFVLRPDQKIVKEDGTYYLLSAKQEFSLLSVSEKNTARIRFLEKQPNISSYLKRLTSHEKLEKFLHQKRLLSAKKRGLMPETVERLENEIALLQRELKKLNPNYEPKFGTPAPSMVPRPTPSKKEKRLLQIALTKMGRKPINSVIQETKHTYQLILGNPGLMHWNTLANRIIPGQPIPPQVLMSLRKYAEQLLMGVEKIKRHEKKLNEKKPSMNPPRPYPQ